MQGEGYSFNIENKEVETKSHCETENLALKYGGC